MRSNKKTELVLSKNNSMTDCPICVEPFAKKEKKKISCCFCGYEACFTCIKTYIFGTTTRPHCMNCKREWNTAFVGEMLGIKELKPHLEKCFAEVEKARLPTLQDRARRARLPQEITDLIQRRKELDAEIKRRQDEWRGGPSEKEKKEQETKIVKQTGCPTPECRGFVVLKPHATTTTCPLCRVVFCVECMEPLKPQKTPGPLNSKETQEPLNSKETEETHTSALQTEPHICDPDTKASVKAVRDESKPCPKCAAPISRVSGCNQMWCVICHTAFDWRTGLIVRAAHNPHYYEWLQTQGAERREERDQDPCNGEPQWTLPQPTPGWTTEEHMTWRRLVPFHRAFGEAGDMLFRLSLETTEQAEQRDLDNLGIKYLLREIDEAKWTWRVANLKLLHARKREVIEVLRTYRRACSDLALRFARRDQMGPLATQLKALGEFTNAAFRRLRKIYGTPASIPREMTAQGNLFF